MRILLGIRICVMHPVHDTVSKRTQVVGALEYPRKNIEYLLCERAHRKRLVGGIPMEEECLKEEGEIPVGGKKAKYDIHFRSGLVSAQLGL